MAGRVAQLRGKFEPADTSQFGPQPGSAVAMDSDEVRISAVSASAVSCRIFPQNNKDFRRYKFFVIREKSP